MATGFVCFISKRKSSCAFALIVYVGDKNRIKKIGILALLTSYLLIPSILKLGFEF